VTLLVLPPNEVDYFESSTGAGAGDVMFVNIEARCCCGNHGRSTCKRGSFLFTVMTWTLSLSMDCDELWTLQAYKGLRQVSWSSQS